MATEHIIKSTYANVTDPKLDLTSFVLQSSKNRGDKVALLDFASGRSYTYQQLPILVNKTAAGLASLGVTKGSVIGMYSPNLPEFAFPFLAASALGAITSLANPTYNAEELSKLLKDSAPSVLFTVAPFLAQAREANTAAGSPVQHFIVFGDAPEGSKPFVSLLANNGEFQRPEINPTEDVVALPYSSGTTGLSKGVMLTHSNIVINILQSLAVESEMTEDDVLIGLLPFFHIYGLVITLLRGLYMGNKIVSMMKFDLEPFLRIVQEHKATYVAVVPPICVALAKHPLVDKFDMSSIRIIVSAAAPLGEDLQSAVEKRLKVPIKQGFGMTELSPCSHAVPSDRIRNGAVGLMGPNMEAKIVHIESGESLPAGKANTGEIWLRGPNVMKGYWNNPKATAESVDADGFYHSGDIGYVDEDGYFYIVDRLKELIKYKGFQVPPAELEDLLLSHPAVGDCAVIGVPDEDAGELPRAYVVKAAGTDVTEDELKEHVAKHTAYFKHLRGGVKFVDAIPKSASGKILRRILKANP